MNCCLEPAAPLRRDEVALVSPVGPDYGSMNVARLDELRRRLGDEVDGGERLDVVVDLRDIEYAGAALIGILAEASAQLRSQNRRLAVWGDRHGLLEATGLASRLGGG